MGKPLGHRLTLTVAQVADRSARPIANTVTLTVAQTRKTAKTIANTLTMTAALATAQDKGRGHRCDDDADGCCDEAGGQAAGDRAHRSPWR